jgi:hypothetical protein
MSPILARAATSCGDPWSERPARRIPVFAVEPRPRRKAQKDFVTLAYTLRRADADAGAVAQLADAVEHVEHREPALDLAKSATEVERACASDASTCV